MENTQLSKRIDRLRDEHSYTLDEIVAYVEELEAEIETKNTRIEELEGRVNDLMSNDHL